MDFSCPIIQPTMREAKPHLRGCLDHVRPASRGSCPGRYNPMGDDTMTDSSTNDRMPTFSEWRAMQSRALAREGRNKLDLDAFIEAKGAIDRLAFLLPEDRGFEAWRLTEALHRAFDPELFTLPID